MNRIPVTVLGATGVVGQRFVKRLANHPLFTIQHLAASERSADKRYSEACAWRLSGEPYGGLGDRMLVPAEVAHAFSPVVFSALDSGPAKELEPAFAAAGATVFSNASTYRMAEDVPLLIPEANADHIELLKIQRQRRGWKGGIVCNSNCTATPLVVALAPLHAAFGVEAVIMSSMQAISGAGYPGVASLDILGNVIPFIRNEEEKVAEETVRMLGRLSGEKVQPALFVVSALCHRVSVQDGHTEAVSVRLKGNPSLEAVREIWLQWKSKIHGLNLPSAPKNPIHLHNGEDRPQPLRDAESEGGMVTHIGRLRSCPVLGIKFTLLGHNAEKGAAGGSVLNAELAHAKGLI